MTPDERRHGTSKCGPCLTRQHERCTYKPCPCTEGEHPKRVAAQADSSDSRYARTASNEAAPAGNRGLTSTTVRSL